MFLVTHSSYIPSDVITMTNVCYTLLTHTVGQDQEQLDQVADTLMDEAINEVTSEFAAMEQRAAVAEKAASYIDNPTLENIMQALERMEVCSLCVSDKV